MGQQPNIRLGFEDLPRPTPKPAAPRRWSPRRPGELGAPDEVPWGGAFGTPGPDIGFAMSIVARMDLPGSDHDRADVAAAVSAVMAARASALGRAPTSADATKAIDLLGLSSDGIDRLDGVAHDRRRLQSIVAEIPRQRLVE